MGRKRKLSTDENTDSEEEIRRKIRRWERKLSKRTKRRRIIYSPDEELSSQWEEMDPATADSPNQPLSPVVHVAHSGAPRAPSPLPDPPTWPPSPAAMPPPSSSPPAPSASNLKETATTEELDIPLDIDILQLLGDEPKADTPLGPPIHKDLASRFQEILGKGLPKEEKEKIFEEYLVPNNCDLLIALNLNPEVKAALSEQLLKRDSFLMHKQKQLGVAKSSLASAMSLMLKNETSKQKLIKPISDACRILCDNHFMETKSRRNFVISATNTQSKEALIESARDKSWLFGENIYEKIKAAKTIQKTGDDLKNQPKIVAKTNYHPRATRGRLNFKPQHRKTDNKPAAAAGSGNSARGRPTRHPPPPRSSQRHSRRSLPRRSAYK